MIEWYPIILDHSGSIYVILTFTAIYLASELGVDDVNLYVEIWNSLDKSVTKKKNYNGGNFQVWIFNANHKAKSGIIWHMLVI